MSGRVENKMTVLHKLDWYCALRAVPDDIPLKIESQRAQWGADKVKQFHAWCRRNAGDRGSDCELRRGLRRGKCSGRKSLVLINPRPTRPVHMCPHVVGGLRFHACYKNVERFAAWSRRGVGHYRSLSAVGSVGSELNPGG